MLGSLRRGIGDLLWAHHSRPHTEILTVPPQTDARRRQPAGDRGACGSDPLPRRGPARTLPARVARRPGRAWRADQHERAVTLLRSPRHHPQKGALYAAEQERADVKAAREAWFAAQPDL